MTRENGQRTHSQWAVRIPKRPKVERLRMRALIPGKADVRVRFFIGARLAGAAVLACTWLILLAAQSRHAHTLAAEVAVTYYVDSDLGNDAVSCEAAQNPATPKRSVNSVLSCQPGAGETVKFRGVFTQTIRPPASGEVLHDVQAIQRVTGSQVEFGYTPQPLIPGVDYVTIYGSRRGNSGAFRVVSASGNTVTVDTSALPARQFLDEAAADPGDLEAAILRPVHYTAWDPANPPLWRTDQQTFHSIDKRVVMVSYLRSDSIGGDQGVFVWPAFEIDGTTGGNADFHIFDHLDIQHAEVGIATEDGAFQANYAILQFNRLHDIGYAGGASDEIIYWGNAYHPERHHDFCQIVYNKVGPHNQYPIALRPPYQFAGDGIEIKPSAHNCTIFGNEVVGTYAINGCDDAPIRISGPNAFVANNYVHDVNPQPGTAKGCGISLITAEPRGEGDAEGSIVTNNIVANVKGVGIRVLDSDNVQIVNNVVYRIFPVEGCEYCVEETIGIMVQNWADSTTNVEIYNNIVHSVPTGIARYPWSRPYPFQVTSGHNIVYNTTAAWGPDIPPAATDRYHDPGLIDPEGSNFAIGPDAFARDRGLDLSDLFTIDNHAAPNPTWPPVVALTLRQHPWDIGAYEYPAPAVQNDGAPPRSMIVFLLLVALGLTLVIGIGLTVRHMA